MTAADFTRLRANAACFLALPGLMLAGCNNVPARDSLDVKTPTGLTVPGAAKAVEKKPAPTLPPPSEADLGMPIYPGAKTYVDDTGAPVPSQISGSMATAMLETPDSMDRVADFYKSKITASAPSGSAPIAPHEDQTDGKRKMVLTGNDAQGNIQMAQIREGGGKTIIELMRTQVKALPHGVPGGSAPDDIISGSASSSSAARPAVPASGASSSGLPASPTSGASETTGSASRP